MKLEDLITKRKHPDLDLLIKYGFIKNNDQYIYKCKMSEEMDAVLIVEEGKLSGKVIDRNFNEEYINFRIEGKLGEYAAKIKANYISILEDLCDKCFIDDYFISEQANQLVNMISNRYGILPQFIFEKHPEIGAFKHANDKWFGLVMEIDYQKIDSNYKGKVEIINIKVDESKMDEYLLIDGIYPSYHMSKKSWISIVLDGRVEINHIFELICKSYDLIDDHLNYLEWIVPCNAKYFDIENLFYDRNECIWKQSTNVHIGDLVYIYASKPFSSVLFMCEVINIDIPYRFRGDVSIEYVMELKHIHSYDFGEFTLERLKEYGVTTIRGPRHIPMELSKALHNF